MKINASTILDRCVALKASSLHLSVGNKPVVRINTKLSPISDMDTLTLEDVELFVAQTLTKEQKDLFEVTKEVDFSIALGNKARFRVNAYYQKGYPAVSLRMIPMVIPHLDDLHLPPILKNIADLKQGFVLVVGPTDHGKSTTLASMLQYITETRSEHIITIEDPIEFIIPSNKSLVEQREMFLDTLSWANALKSILRQDPNIIMIGEMRDQETIEAAMNIAETGHLVFSTLHTNSASQSIERIVSSFPKEKQSYIRSQFADVLEAVISMRLVPSAQMGALPAVEVLLNNYAVKNMIREGKSYRVDDIILTSSEQGMISLNTSLLNLLNKDLISVDDAFKFSLNPEELRRLIKR
ncbi:type IV pili twitching motility protein PilT [candidate division WWE3 bacterium CG08_land_8_20_14_0_20_41_10]|uniref:Type IV pili twitching motility protein PilT n=1 Tax=candidate division WWE3 bacterium CG08_land_8_20_14_0_20_41_10 TaxID=1975085 RepID=A0A2H0XCA4_UNCKA|nr:MAG: type IV pili twitching motility protein PilT [candidate division WWE3 bacterium CG08_land_8_20_14_0_20_41_10]